MGVGGGLGGMEGRMAGQKNSVEGVRGWRCVWKGGQSMCMCFRRSLSRYPEYV